MVSSVRFEVLRAAYRRGTTTPVQVVEQVLEAIARRGDDHVWTTLADPMKIRGRARALAARVADIDTLPLYGLPFGVKDNVDVCGVPTTCGCPGFSRLPQATALAVRKAEEAGAIFIGKQALDQFATGLNGTRTFGGGHCRNVFDPAIIPGGSSSGSGVAVAAGLVSFSLGSDTGGSGRVPAAMNNIVGVRPTLGLVSSRGMVYNNRLFDCMPVFAGTVDEAYTVLEAIAGVEADEPIRRSSETEIALDPPTPNSFSFAVPNRLDFLGDPHSAVCFTRAIGRLQAIGGSAHELDLEVFLEAGSLVFDSALVAERAASYGEVLDDCPQQLVPAVATILSRARQYSAAEAFRAMYRLQSLQGRFAEQFRGIDLLVTPTVPRPFTVEEMLAEPLLRNAEVGHYTLAVGPLDLCALALPAAIRPDGLPFGISLVGRAGADGLLRAIGRKFEVRTGIPPGLEAVRRTDPRTAADRGAA